MSDAVTVPDDFDSLAAEYVLGTLDADERTRANVLLDVDHGFRSKVRLWERRFGELHLMVEPVEPDTQTWERLKARIGDPLSAPAPKLVDLEKLVEDKRATPTTPDPETEPVEKKPEPIIEVTAAIFGTEIAPVVTASADARPAPAEPDAMTQIELALQQVRQQEAARASEPVEDMARSLPADTITRAPPVIGPPPEPWSLVTETRLPGGTPPPRLPPPKPKADRSAERVAIAEEAPQPEQPVPERRAELTNARGRRLETRRPQQRRGRYDTFQPWRIVAMFMTMVVALLGALISAWRYAPDRLPPSLRPTAVLNLQSDFVRIPAPPGSEFDE
jgi:anti-sigma-K factor RskA